MMLAQSLNYLKGVDCMTDQKTMESVHEIGYEMLAWFDALCKKYDIQYFMGYGVLLGAVRHKGFIPWDDDIDLWMMKSDYETLMRHRDEFPEDAELILPTSYGTNKYYDCVAHIKYKYMYRKVAPGVYEYYNKVFPSGMHIDIFFLDKTYNDFRGFLQRMEMAALYGLMNSYRHRTIQIENYPLHWKICGSILKIFGRHIPLSRMFQWQEKIADRYSKREDAKYYFSGNCGLNVGNVFPIKLFEKIMYAPFGPLMVPIPEGADEILRTVYGDYMTPPPENGRVLPDGIVFKAKGAL